MEQTESFFRS